MKTLDIQYKFVVLLVVLNGLLSIPALLNSVPMNLESLASGEVTAELETLYEEDLPLRDFAVNTWTAFSLIVFGEGKPGVIVGEEGWLYTDEEFVASKDAAEVYAENLNYIREVRDELSANDIELVIVPVPSKARVYHEFTKDTPAQAHLDLYQSFDRDIDELTITTAKSLDMMIAQKPVEPMFLQTDTHWTPAGARQVADAAAAAAFSETEFRGGQVFQTHVGDARSMSGDLAKFVPVSPWYEFLAFSAATISEYQTGLTEVDLFAEPVAPNVALVGTSYSATVEFHFAGFLKQALGADLINFSRKGEGPFAPMKTFLTELPNAQTIELVIWDIPERYLINKTYMARED